MEEENIEVENKVQGSAKAQYIPKGIPAELPDEKSGTGVGVFSIIFAIVAIAIYPIIFGPVGIAFGITAKKRGSDTLGIVGIVLSSVFMIIGIILGLLFYEDAGASGMVLFGLL